MMKKIFCLLLALILTVLPLAACGGDSDTSDESEQSSVDYSLVPHLGEADYSGKTLKILSMYEDAPYGKCMFGVTELTDEPINDACFERLQTLKDAYGFDVNVEFVDTYPAFVTRIKTDFLAGNSEYDVCCGGVGALTAVATSGALMDINSISNSHIELDQPWWDSFASDGLTLKGKLFCITGDIIVLDDEYTNCIFYNKSLIEDHQLDNPSELALEGKWTLDAMYTMMKEVAFEADDGSMDVFGEDVWGMLGSAFTLHTLISGCNCPITSRDSDGTPILAMMDSRNVTAFDKCYEIITDKSCAAYSEQYFRWDDTDSIAGIYNANFYSGRCLFFPANIQTVNTDVMRSCNIRYGLLPMPKLDEEQEFYANSVNPYHFCCLSIVSGCKDTDFVTFALEALAYTGKKLITPEYYERTLKNKRFSDDNDSPEVLDIIFSQRLLDLSIIYNWGDCIQYYNNMLWNNQGLASYADSVTGKFNESLKETLDEFVKLSGAANEETSADDNT